MSDLAIFFTASGEDDYPFDDPEYRSSYHLLAQLLTERGASCTIVRGPETYCGDTCFRGGWHFIDGHFERHEEERSYDLLFLKGHLATDPTAHTLNDPALERLCTDKWQTYQAFRSLCSKTVCIEQPADIPRALTELQTALIVGKPLDREGGNGVFVAPRREVVHRVPSYPYLLQEFIDTSGGIPGITAGLHDFRLVVIDGEIISSLLRVPKDESYLANVSQGGSERMIDLADIPARPRTICQEVDARFARFGHRLYSVDLARDPQGEWKLIELNTQPGLATVEQYRESAAGRNFFDRAVDLLLTAAREE